jgi:hypothetical protein
MGIKEVGWDDIDWMLYAQGSDQYWDSANKYEVLGSIK